MLLPAGQKRFVSPRDAVPDTMAPGLTDEIQIQMVEKQVQYRSSKSHLLTLRLGGDEWYGMLLPKDGGSLRCRLTSRLSRGTHRYLGCQLVSHRRFGFEWKRMVSASVTKSTSPEDAHMRNGIRGSDSSGSGKVGSTCQGKGLPQIRKVLETGPSRPVCIAHTARPGCGLSGQTTINYEPRPKISKGVPGRILLSPSLLPLSGEAPGCFACRTPGRLSARLLMHPIQTYCEALRSIRHLLLPPRLGKS